MRKKKEKKIIGRTEIVDFPELQIFNIEAQVDTGAYTSALHCEDVRLEIRDGKKWLIFKVFTHGNDTRSLQEVAFSNFYKKKIKNSFGHIENRFIIMTTIGLFGEKFNIEISLADREKMRYPVLLGRKLLKGRFVVDVAKKNQGLKGL
mgnify:CR=1 FL=1